MAKNSDRISSRPIRALVVYCYFPHYRAGVIRELARTGSIDFHFAADSRTNHKDIPAFASWDDLPYIPVASFRIGRLELQPLLPLRVLQWRRSFDVIIFLGNPNIATTWIGLGLCRLFGIRTLLWTHGWLSPDSGAKGFLRDAFYRLADGLLLYGARAKELGVARGFEPGRMFVIWNSLDYETQRRWRLELEGADRAGARYELLGFYGPALLCSARVTKRSAQWLILDAIDCLRQRGIDVGLVLIGDGEDLCRVAQEAKERGIKHRFFGAIYDESRIAEITMACDITVSPGKVGLTAMQSMAYGIPVISHGTMALQMPESEAIAPGVTGDFFEYGNPDQLSTVIERWLKLLHVRREEIRRDCIAMIEERYCPRVQAREMCRAVESIFGGSA